MPAVMLGGRVESRPARLELNWCTTPSKDREKEYRRHTSVGSVHVIVVCMHSGAAAHCIAIASRVTRARSELQEGTQRQADLVVAGARGGERGAQAAELGGLVGRAVTKRRDLQRSRATRDIQRIDTQAKHHRLTVLGGTCGDTETVMVFASD